MAISENQLDTWSHQGSITQSKETYATIRRALEDVSAAYSQKDYSMFLQGSYGNDTNIWADSDVDVVMKLESTYQYDIDELPENEKVQFHAKTTGATYSYTSFKSDVVAQLNLKFPGSIKIGNKAIAVKGNGTRRDADVVPAMQYRKYLSFKDLGNERYIEGICFWATDGSKIINYPKLHSENCTTKHQMTFSRFKSTVRIFKNMRNAMIDSGFLEDGIAPSYFLEGMIYNVPNDQFTSSKVDTVANVVNWLIKCDKDKLLCANEQYYLLHPTSSVTWRAERFEKFLNAVVKFWNS